jgi:hypothetical protein
MVVGTLRGIGDEFLGLLTRAGVTWWRFAPWLVGLMLVGWVGYYGSVLLGTELAFHWPWLVIFGLAFGAVVQLATIVIALRLLLERSEVTADAAVEAAATPPGLVRLVAQTLLPFLAIYAAFGFVDNYARDVMLALTGRYGFFGGSEFISQINPAKSSTTMAIVIGIAVALYLMRRGLDWLARRSDRAWIGLLGAFLEASGLLLVLLSAFRIVELIKLWLDERQLAAWWDAVYDTLFGWIRLDGIWLSAWEFLAANAWPALWDVLAQPLAWLALTAVVAGIRVGSSAELLGQARGDRGAALGKVANGFFTGDLDDKFLRHAVRFLATAGIPLLGGYVLAFTAIDWLGGLVESGVDQLIGPQIDDAALLTIPFYDLLSMVLVLGLRLALLGVTVARVSEAIADGGTPRRPRLGETLTVVAVCGALALSSLALSSREDVRIVAGEIGAPMAMFSAQVTVGEPLAGLELAGDYSSADPTERTFLVVPVKVFEERGGSTFFVGLHAGGRYYDPWSAGVSLNTQAGFATEQDVVFEVAPEDLTGELMLEVRPGGSLRLGNLRGEVTFSAPEPQPQVHYRSSPERSVP